MYDELWEYLKTGNERILANIPSMEKDSMNENHCTEQENLYEILQHKYLERHQENNIESWPKLDNSLTIIRYFAKRRGY